jgi:predicted metal-dependent hydrolase
VESRKEVIDRFFTFIHIGAFRCKEKYKQYNNVKFMKLEKRWVSCTPSNTIIININAIKLPFSLIEYLVVH